jgi:Bax protein
LSPARDIEGMPPAHVTHRRPYDAVVPPNPFARCGARRGRLALLAPIVVGFWGLALAALPSATEKSLVPGPDGDASTWTKVEFRSNDEVWALWEKCHFTPQEYRAATRTAPRIYVADIPARWGRTMSGRMTVSKKKATFLLGLAPMVLAVDEEVSLERDKLLAIIGPHAAGEPFEPGAASWLEALGDRYGVTGGVGDRSALDELKARVDAIPVSLVLAQAATESGWGTSRFAAEGSALFGQWSYGEGIKPKEQRTESKGDYRVRSFDTPLDSIRAYLLNLNTHRSYAELRRYRADLREKGKQVTGVALAPGLLHYSERGQAYVDELLALMRRNHLEQADVMTLRTMTPILLVPVGAGVDD